MDYEIASDEHTGHAVINLVSIVENTAVDDLPPLYGSIDPDALNTICEDWSNIHVSFAYSNSQVEVYCGEYITAETV
ncbi:HalOD1 output domain-containing protein [Haloplanus natans]|uniref:HalOD1 output domain-containing protein n=1 Tax=Haloplanus natans TaxID=376171 RepID=UPI0012FAB4F6|nr:HalOD1 output domain-containing protein [Haloplanus natans]